MDLALTAAIGWGGVMLAGEMALQRTWRVTPWAMAATTAAVWVLVAQAVVPAVVGVVATAGTVLRAGQDPRDEGG